MKEMFLDANAHTPMSLKAREEYLRIQSSPAGHGHPSSPSVPGRAAAEEMERARARIASLLGADKPSQIIFTSSCTQACEFGMEMFLYGKLKEQEVNSFAISALEHPAVKQAYRKVADVYAEGYNDGHSNTPILEYSIPTDLTGRLNPTMPYDKGIAHLLHNETGVIQDLSKFTTTPLFSDMCQAAGKMPVSLKDQPNVKTATFGAHKFGGPGGIGFLYLKDLNDYSAFGTGSRYFLDRPGTPDVAGIAATAVALQEAIDTMDERKENQIAFRNTLEPALEEMGFQIVCKDSNRTPSTTFAILPERALTLLFELGKQNIHIGLGSACGAMNVGKNQSLEVMGYEAGQHSAVRISQWGQYGTEDAGYFVDKVKKALRVI
jgi:cysteine desulfurase